MMLNDTKDPYKKCADVAHSHNSLVNRFRKFNIFRTPFVCFSMPKCWSFECFSRAAYFKVWEQENAFLNVQAIREVGDGALY